MTDRHIDGDDYARVNTACRAIAPRIAVTARGGAITSGRSGLIR